MPLMVTAKSGSDKTTIKDAHVTTVKGLPVKAITDKLAEKINSRFYTDMRNYYSRVKLFGDKPLQALIGDSRVVHDRSPKLEPRSLSRAL